MNRPRNRWPRKRRHSLHRPRLRFTPYAWAKLLFLRDAGPTEVGGFGIAAAEDLLLIEDVRLVTQICTRTSVLFDDAAVADYFDACVDADLPPERFARIWIHTHPGASAEPSQTDEQTFARVFGGCDWSVMAILSREGECYSRLRFNTGPGGELRLPIDVAYDVEFRGTDCLEWEAQYRASVSVPAPADGTRTATRRSEGRDLAGATAELQLSPADRISRIDFADVPASDFDFWGFDDDDDDFYTAE
jgi:proteasome lid subunit RPN8/RPN11